MTKKELMHIANKISDVRYSIEKEDLDVDLCLETTDKIFSLLYPLFDESDVYLTLIQDIMRILFHLSNLLLKSKQIKIFIPTNEKDFFISGITQIETLIYKRAICLK